jgi:hypothetical protein
VERACPVEELEEERSGGLAVYLLGLCRTHDEWSFNMGIYASGTGDQRA